MERVFVDDDGPHAHSRRWPAGKDADHSEAIVGTRLLWRAVCTCGRVFESGSETNARHRLNDHIKSKE